jgi:protein-disulfide isomerase
MNLRRASITLLLVPLACATSNTPAAAPVVPVPAATPPPSTSSVAVARATTPSEEDAAIPISTRNPSWGSRVAPVTIVEFADLQCPYSRKVVDTLSALREAYGPEKLRIVWKNNPLPFHPNAASAAEAATGVFIAGGRDAFWRFHDLAFGNQKSLSRDQYLVWAQQVGVVDVSAYSAGLDGHQWSFAVEEDRHEAATLGATGTPSFFINGVPVTGAQPIDTFRKIIDEQLARAQAQLDAGTPPERVYAKLAADNHAVALLDQQRKDREKAAAADERARTVFKIPLGKAPARGPATALVTIVEFADFQCPFSARVQPTLDALRAEYGDKLRIVWKNEPLPFHKAGEPAAEAALEVRAEKGDAAFWDMHDRLFAAQKNLVQGDAPDTDAIADLANAAGGNRGRVQAAMAGRTFKAQITADADLADDFKATGTPSFFVNGRPIVGAQPKEKFEKLIDEEMGKAEILVKQGVRPADVYATVTKNGAGAVPPEQRDLPSPMPAGDPVRGNAAAPVTVHEWADFQCPFCAREESTLQKIVQEYGSKIRFVWHDLPLPTHAQASLSAEAAREAFAQKGVAGFWAMHDALYANQGHLERADLDGYASTLHLDAGRWAAALDGEQHASEIDADAKAAGYAGITGTPGFLVVAHGASRGYFLSGAQDARLRKLIDRALTEAR